MIQRIYTGIFFIILLSATACKRDKFYRCICTTGGSTYGKTDVIKLGRMPEAQAYEACRKKQSNKAIECIMEVHK